MNAQKNEIIRRAFALFKQYGLKSVSMDTIASELGVSKKTLYVHFSTKEELIQHGVRKVADAFQLEFDRILSVERPPLVSLSLIFYTILQEVFKYDRAYFYTVRRYSSVVLQEVDALRQTIREAYAKPLLKKAQALNCLQPEWNMDIFIEMNLSEIDNAYSRLMEKHPLLSVSDAYWHLIVYPINGICAAEYSKDYLAEIREEIKKQIG